MVTRRVVTRDVLTRRTSRGVMSGAVAPTTYRCREWGRRTERSSESRSSESSGVLVVSDVVGTAVQRRRTGVRAPCQPCTAGLPSGVFEQKLCLFRKLALLSLLDGARWPQAVIAPRIY